MGDLVWQGSSLDEVVDLVPHFLKTKRARNTRISYENDLRRFFSDVLGSDVVTIAAVRMIGPAVLNHYIDHLQGSGFSAATIRRRISAISSFFRWCAAIPIIERNPVVPELVQQPKASRRRHVLAITESEARRLLQAASEGEVTGVRDYAMIRLMLYTWLRRSEVAAMNIEDIQVSGAHHIIRLPHTKKGDDDLVKAPGHVVSAIERMKQHYGWTSGPVWRSLSNNSAGRRLSHQAIYEIVNRNAVRAGLSEKIGAHTMRHTGITLAVKAKAPIHKVKEQARHETLDTTMSYVHQDDFLEDNASDYLHI